MRYGRLAATTLLLAALAGRHGHAQGFDARGLDALTPGTRVRVLLPEQQRQGDYLGGGHLLRGMLVRLTADTMYLAVTDSLGPLAAGDNDSNERSYGEWALVSGATWFAVGAAWGAIFPMERWQRVQLAPVVTSGRVGGLRVSWRGRW